MKRIAALLCAALLACLCLCACGEKPGPQPDPAPKASAALLTLYIDPLRVATRQEGVTVTLQMLEYEPTLHFPRPYMDIWEETLEPGREYALDAELAEGIPQYRLFVQQGENIAIHDLAYDGKDGLEIAGKPWTPAPIDKDSPMIHLCRMASFAPGFETYDYWYAIANAITTLRSVDLEMSAQEEEDGDRCYRIPEWLFEAYAAALFPGMDVPSLEKGGSEYVSYHTETHERYWVRDAYSTWIWAEYKSAKRNPDGTWDVTITVGTTDDDETGDTVIKLAPNEAYNPDSPFEYHLVGLPTEPDRAYGDTGDEPNPGIEGMTDGELVDYLTANVEEAYERMYEMRGPLEARVPGDTAELPNEGGCRVVLLESFGQTIIRYAVATSGAIYEYFPDDGQWALMYVPGSVG